jgi:hypothetical protein
VSEPPPTPRPAARRRPAAPPASRAPQASRAADQPHVWPHRPQATRKGWPYYIRLLLRPCEHLVYSRATPCGWPGARVWSAARVWPVARVAGGACGRWRVWPVARVAGGACGQWRAAGGPAGGLTCRLACGGGPVGPIALHDYSTLWQKGQCMPSYFLTVPCSSHNCELPHMSLRDALATRYSVMACHYA